jgi:hypothetical protein
LNRKQRIIHKMIELALDKFLRDVEENPKRAIRNLVDLGSYFAHTGFHQDFLRVAAQMLRNEDSLYYELTARTGHAVAHSIIKRFGINLGLNSWTVGAEMIRQYAEQEGYGLPWVITFDLREAAAQPLSRPELGEIVSWGEERGIYSFIFLVGAQHAQLAAALATAADHQESACFIFAQPEIIGEEVAGKALAVGNVALVLKLDPADSQPTLAAARLLQKQSCLYGVYCEYDDENIPALISQATLSTISATQAGFVFFLRRQLNCAENRRRFADFLETGKSANKHAFFLIDFYSDLAYIDQRIGVNACFLAIGSDGSAALDSLENRQPELNVRSQALDSILRQAMSG